MIAASSKVLRGVPLLHGARGFCLCKHDVNEKAFLQQAVALLDQHVMNSGRELYGRLKDLIHTEPRLQLELVSRNQELQSQLVSTKEMLALQNHVIAYKDQMIACKDQVIACKDQVIASKEQVIDFLEKDGVRCMVEVLESKGLNNTMGLWEHMEELVAMRVLDARLTTTTNGTKRWESILRDCPALRACIAQALEIPDTDVSRLAADCCLIYTILSQHIHSGKQLAALEPAGKLILFDRGPLSTQQVKIFVCIANEAKLNVAEDPMYAP